VVETTIPVVSEEQRLRIESAHLWFALCSAWASLDVIADRLGRGGNFLAEHAQHAADEAYAALYLDGVPDDDSPATAAEVQDRR